MKELFLVQMSNFPTPYTAEHVMSHQTKGQRANREELY